MCILYLTMQVKHEKDAQDGSFYLKDNGKNIGTLQYTLTGDNQMEIYHTEIDPDLRGKDLGIQLVEAAVKYAREESLKIIPSCTFAKAVFARKQDFQDVLA